MIANRRRRGTTSRKSSSRLAARSVAWPDRPVTLPPGRARLATKPPPTGSFAIAKTMGMTDVAFFIVGTASPFVTMQSTFRWTNSGDAVEASLQPAVFDCLDPAEFTQSPHKGSRPWPPDRSVRAQEPNGRRLARLLRARNQRPPRCCAAECCQQLPSSDGDCHTPLPCEVRRGKDTTRQACCPI